MKKIAFVVQRYGLEVNGGAELECRMYAERLTDRYEVHVLTSKAVDYITWKDEYQREEELLNGVHVKRFSVAHPRTPKTFDAINSRFLRGLLPEELEPRWLEEQGPYLPDLIAYLGEHKDEYESILFMTYLYYPTCMGVKAVPEKAITIPTAHDEPFLQSRMFDDVFKAPAAIFYNTFEEKEFVEGKYQNQAIRSEIGGVGIELPEKVDAEAFREKYGLDQYLIYVGRIDTGKNCDMLFKYFREYKKRNPGDLKLVLMGKNVIPVPEDPDIVNLGFVSEEDKYNGMAGARMLVLPSRFESLSMVVLESMALSVPVVVNGVCEVLKGHCTKSNAGLYYTNYFEFEGAVNYLLSHGEIREQMGENGVRYVEENYQWRVIIDRLSSLIEYVGETRRKEADQ